VLGRSETIVDLVPDVDPDRDHYAGPSTPRSPSSKYGDFEWPVLRQAEPAVRELLAGTATSATSGGTYRSTTSTRTPRSRPTAAEAAHKAGGVLGDARSVADQSERLEVEDLTGYRVGPGLDAERFAADSAATSARRGSPRTSTSAS